MTNRDANNQAARALIAYAAFKVSEAGDLAADPSRCGLTECQGKPRCKMCKASGADGGPVTRGADLAAELLECREDAGRIEWLARQCVVVRLPLRHGSREAFSGSPDLEEESWDIRAAIDVLRAKGGAA